MNRSLTVEFFLIPLSFVIAIAIPIVFEPLNGRLILFLFLLLLYCGISLARPLVGAIGLVLLQFFQAELRRYVGFIYGFGGFDPILLIAPAAVLVMMFSLLVGRNLKNDTRISKLVVILIGFMVIEIFNPLQGGVAIGIGGAMFYLIPVLSFWIGRTYFTEATVVMLAMKIVVPVAVLAAILGMYQTFVGYFDYEQAWLVAAHWDRVVDLNGLRRAVSFLTSPAEYGRILVFAIVLIWCAWLKRRSPLILLMPFIFVALYFAGMRSAIFVCVFSMAALWAAMGRSQATWAPRIVIALVLGIAGILFGADQSQQAAKGSASEALISHQSEGLANPLDEKKSTGKIHLAMIGYGIAESFRNPLGHGLGATTLAAGKFGGETENTEVDISNMFLSLGCFGGLVYVVLLWRISQLSLSYWNKERSFAALIILGILVSSIFSVLSAGDYAKNQVTWLLIGALDRIAGGAALRFSAARESRGQRVESAVAA